ncbi:unnamed protein product [Polarella glacialis]|uniref:Uncharacterized protein n=1 Tax=Polarella glacialis TaxID=89957 RepID=A0A813E6Z1_POLGL|nr:unnamed protein product [Polarella glacialis]
MVLGEAVAGAAAGAHALWNYNRDNFLYDRKQRQETELAILEWRSAQAELWRDDVRDIIGLTEKKMESYLIVSTLQLGMCLGLLTEGRLEPGTPPWLLHFYMLTLGAAFMYLLMSVWMAMHASIVAQSSSVRILTQFVRLPVPTWETLQEMRTFASSFENLGSGNMVRVPFTNHAKEGAGEQKGERQSNKDRRRKRRMDPWKLEEQRAKEEIHELMNVPAAMRRHVCLARRAGKQYQCYDAFSRVAMAFGTNQLLHALSYYALGYICLQDGAPWPAVCVLLIMACISMALVRLDFAFDNAKQELVAQVLIVTGPLASAAAVVLWLTQGTYAKPIIMALLPVIYASHGLWLFFALVSCGLELQSNGAVLPQKFRAVLYMDVFGWLKQKHELDGVTVEQSGDDGRSISSRTLLSTSEESGNTGREALAQLRRDMSDMQRPETLHRGKGEDFLGEWSPASRKEPPGIVESARDAVTPLMNTLLEPDDSGGQRGPAPGEYPTLRRADSIYLGAGPNPSGEMSMTRATFDPGTYQPKDSSGFPGLGDDEEIVSGHDSLQPGKVPAKIFRQATMLLIFLWAIGLALPFGVVREFMVKPLMEKIVVETEPGAGHQQINVVVGTRPDGLPELIPVAMAVEALPSLPEGQLISVNWPRNRGFVPRSLSSDPSGTQFAVADDLGVYGGRLVQSSQVTSDGTLPLVGSVHLRRVPPCSALEGQALQDIGIACDLDAHDRCRIVVLHSEGRRLAECPLPMMSEGSKSWDSEAMKKLLMRPPITWEISENWLHRHHRKQETIQALAVNSECLRQDPGQARAFCAEPVGCVVVGTSYGRIVQLRGAQTDSRQLVPERSMEQRLHGVKPGSLDISTSGYVLTLRHDTGTMQAFDSKSGTSVGEWRLPGNLQWLALGGGGNYMFLLGLRNDTSIELRRIPVPDKLKGRHKLSNDHTRMWKMQPSQYEPSLDGDLSAQPA